MGTKESNDFKYDVAIIGACGHVGLPMAIVFANKGLNVLGVDINLDAIKTVSNGKMPFIEEGAEELLQKVINRKLTLTDNPGGVKDSKYIIITAGTPIDKDLNSDLSQIESVVQSLIPLLRKGQTIILRSTLAPKTTDYIRLYLSSKSSLELGKDIFLVFAPERIVEGHAVKELETLPQIIGAYEDEGFNLASKLFSRITSNRIIRVTPLEAELCKLFANNWRYVTFGIANEYFIIADRLGANIYNVINAANYGYERSKIPMPGFTKGPCLGKDSWLLVNSIPYMGHSTGIVSSAFRINESIPAYIIHRIKEDVPDLMNKRILVLGMTFKKDIDDLRDSLSTKLIKILKNEFLHFDVHDPFVKKHSHALEKKLGDADIIIIAVNHSMYENPDIYKNVKEGSLIVDIWDVTKKNKFIWRYTP